MDAKKKAAPKSSSSASVEPKQPESDETPLSALAVDPTLSSDGRFSSYEDNNDAFPPETGNQVVQILGQPDKKTPAL